MSRPAFFEHPMRLHISLEKKTLDSLRKLARQKSETITELIRRLARLYAEGRISLSEEPLEDIISCMRESRERRGVFKDRSENLIRDLRDHGG